MKDRIIRFLKAAARAIVRFLVNAFFTLLGFAGGVVITGGVIAGVIAVGGLLGRATGDTGTAVRLTALFLPAILGITLVLLGLRERPLLFIKPMWLFVIGNIFLVVATSFTMSEWHTYAEGLRRPDLNLIGTLVGIGIIVWLTRRALKKVNSWDEPDDGDDGDTEDAGDDQEQDS